MQNILIGWQFIFFIGEGLNALRVYFVMNQLLRLYGHLSINVFGACKWIIILYSGIIFSCNSARVVSDYDRNVKFNDFKTYNFNSIIDDSPIGSLNVNSFKSAISIEMENRGLMRSDDPDVIVNFNIATTEGRYFTEDASGKAYTSWNGGYGAGFTVTNTNTNEYTDGTLFINVIDVSRNEIVWQGRGTKTLNKNLPPEKIEASINKAVYDIFQKYPIPRHKE